MNNLRLWRIKHKMKQKDVAALLGKSRARIANIESGGCKISIYIAHKLAETPEEFLWLLGNDYDIERKRKK